MVRLCLLRPGSLSRTDQKQIAMSRSCDRHDRGAVLACSRRIRHISGCLWRWRWGGDPKRTKRHRGAEFCRVHREAARYVFDLVAAADVLIAGLRYGTFVLVWQSAERAHWALNSQHACRHHLLPLPFALFLSSWTTIVGMQTLFLFVVVVAFWCCCQFECFFVGGVFLCP